MQLLTLTGPTRASLVHPRRLRPFLRLGRRRVAVPGVERRAGRAQRGGPAERRGQSGGPRVRRGVGQ